MANSASSRKDTVPAVIDGGGTDNTKYSDAPARVALSDTSGSSSTDR
jgi:hypothetical protein